MCECSLVANPSRDAIPIKSLEKWHHDAARTLERLPQIAHSRWSVFGNGIDDSGFHALEILTQQNHICVDFDDLSILNQKLKDLLRTSIQRNLFTRWRVKWLSRERFANFYCGELELIRQGGSMGSSRHGRSFSYKIVPD